MKKRREVAKARKNMKVEVGLACENILFSPLFAAGNVPAQNVPSGEVSEEKRMFSQAKVELFLSLVSVFLSSFFLLRVASFVDYLNARNAFIQISIRQ